MLNLHAVIYSLIQGGWLATPSTPPGSAPDLVMLSEGSVIQHINFKHNNCDVGHDDSDLHVDECVNMLPINKSLEYINLSQCKLSNLMTHRVLLTLSNCRSLTYLSLCSCSISSVLLLGSIITNWNI